MLCGDGPFFTFADGTLCVCPVPTVACPLRSLVLGKLRVLPCLLPAHTGVGGARSASAAQALTGDCPPRPARLPQQSCQLRAAPPGSAQPAGLPHAIATVSSCLALRPQPFPGAIFFLPDGRLSLRRCSLFLWTLLANWGPFSSFFVKRFLLGCTCPSLEPEGRHAERSWAAGTAQASSAQLGPSRLHVTDSLSSPPATFDASMGLFHF